MFDRFTDRARKVMALARKEAQRFNHDFIGTEHILLGLIQEGSGVAANVLKNLGVEINKIRSEIEKNVQSGPSMVTMGQLPFTPRAKKVLELSMEEANELGHNYIGTEHLLLGLVREENGVAVKVLRELGVEPGQVIRAVERTVGRGERAPFGKPTLAPRTKRVIELAVDEARLMGHHYIGTEHLLLGLVREGEGIAVNVLRGLGINLDRVRTQTARNLLQNQAQSKEKQKKESKTPLVDQLGFDLTAAAEEGRLDPVIGRHNEIERVIQILSRRNKNNPLFVGDQGVGKTHLVEGLAVRIKLLLQRVLLQDENLVFVV